MLRVKEVIFLEKDHTNQLSKSSQIDNIQIEQYIFWYLYICTIICIYATTMKKRDYEFDSKERGGGLDTVKGMRKCCNYIMILKR